MIRKYLLLLTRFLTRIYESIDPTASKVARPEIIIAPDIDLPSFPIKSACSEPEDFTGDINKIVLYKDPDDNKIYCFEIDELLKTECYCKSLHR